MDLDGPGGGGGGGGRAGRGGAGGMRGPKGGGKGPMGHKLGEWTDLGEGPREGPEVKGQTAFPGQILFGYL